MDKQLEERMDKELTISLIKSAITYLDSQDAERILNQAIGILEKSMIKGSDNND